MSEIIKINGTTIPTPAVDGVTVTNRYLLADAERTPDGMHFEQLGEVWEVSVTFPSLKGEEYSLIYNAIKPFVVNLTFYNPITNTNMTIQTYRSDIALQRKWKTINNSMTITFIGTETL